MNHLYEKSLIIIPTYNEAKNIERMVETLFNLYPQISLLIIEDGSPDGTANIIKGLMTKHSNLFIIERSGKQGLGTAYTTGFKWALERSYEYILEMDCDFSHDPKNVSDLINEATKNDLVIGSRYVNGIRIINWPFKRLLLSYLGSMYTRFITGLPLYDTTGGFKCFTRKALQSLNFDKIISNGYGFQLEINYKIFTKGLKIKEVPIIFYERTEGESKMGGNIIVEAFFNVIRLRFKHTLGTL